MREAGQVGLLGKGKRGPGIAYLGFVGSSQQFVAPVRRSVQERGIIQCAGENKQ